MVKKLLFKLFYVILLMVSNLYDFPQNNAYTNDYVYYESFLIEKEDEVEVELITNSILTSSVYNFSYQKNILRESRNYISTTDIFKPPKNYLKII